MTLVTAIARQIDYIRPVETQKGIDATMDLGEVLRVHRCLSPLVGHADIQRDKKPSEVLFCCRHFAGSKIVQRWESLPQQVGEVVSEIHTEEI